MHERIKEEKGKTKMTRDKYFFEILLTFICIYFLIIL
jgi:hypothetical protein